MNEQKNEQSSAGGQRTAAFIRESEREAEQAAIRESVHEVERMTLQQIQASLSESTLETDKKLQLQEANPETPPRREDAQNLEAPRISLFANHALHGAEAKARQQEELPQGATHINGLTFLRNQIAGEWVTGQRYEDYYASPPLYTDHQAEIARNKLIASSPEFNKTDVEIRNSLNGYRRLFVHPQAADRAIDPVVTFLRNEIAGEWLTGQRYENKIVSPPFYTADDATAACNRLIASSPAFNKNNVIIWSNARKKYARLFVDPQAAIRAANDRPSNRYESIGSYSRR